MKKITILSSGGNELANQLWNYASIYAYSLERGYKLENPSFFEYGDYFTTPAAPNFIFKLFFFLPFKNYTKRKTAFRRRSWRKFYTWYVKVVSSFHKQEIIYSGNEKQYYLPPTKNSSGKLHELENSDSNIYFDGWLFRNSVGLEKYRQKIKEYFKPRGDVEKKVVSETQTIRKKYKNVIGVHIRQGDYKTWRGGQYLIPQKRALEIIEEYLSFSGLNKNETCFFIASDGLVDEKIFSGLNTFISKENAITDLFMLSQTDGIIGSNSTFGAFASYYGNIPFIVMENEKMNWEYYGNKNKFFENKYSTFVHY